MRLGVLLPTFQSSPQRALEVAANAAALGLDGIFCYDHLWPMGSPERPAIAPFEVLSVAATRHDSLVVGPLVARVGLVDNEVLLSQLRALGVVAAGRLIAALGTGDRLSREENLAFGIDYTPPDERRDQLRRLAGTLLDEGTEVWVGAGAPKTNAIAAELGCTLNLWNTSLEDVERAAELAAVSWAGTAPARDDAVDLDATVALLRALERAGSTWAVFSTGTPLEVLVRAVELAHDGPR
ncbi:MAG TPA: LLM class flavin-dependent oxidoreductase [Acidimicrobiales bacterium]|jgi:alkanesulfonate monooxygenase SsuD/methylene tetrahydromethanopterin reductase-like flavin-dependent oxidoreductase (luciferase family)|nr:LLM class flavin-dependent oxidoreductase [Acidimicrobiales bacterium]